MKSKNLASIILASALLLMTTSCAKEPKESSMSASDSLRGAATELTSESASEAIPDSSSVKAPVPAAETSSSATTTPSTLAPAATTPQTSSTEAPTKETSKSASKETSKPTSEETSKPTSKSTSKESSQETSADPSETPSKEQPSDDTANPITQIEMPNVMGMHYKDATELLKEKLKAAGYTDVVVSLGWAWGNGDMKKTFTVIGQEPAAGTLLDTSSSSICVIIYAQEYGIE
ncbi:MAG: hypothetical protein IKI87_03050 [Clostridiales bacterium]|nr:hypothetical protein [Clostridiales bacterium]